MRVCGYAHAACVGGLPGGEEWGKARWGWEQHFGLPGWGKRRLGGRSLSWGVGTATSTPSLNAIPRTDNAAGWRGTGAMTGYTRKGDSNGGDGLLD